MRIPVSLAAVLLCCVPGERAQTPVATDPSAVAPLTLAAELAKLAAEAEQLRSALPSFDCTEVVSSKELKDGEVKRRVEMKANLRVERLPDGTMIEKFTATERNGKPFSGQPKLPLYVRGGFQAALNYVSERAQPCYRYKLTPGRLDFDFEPAAATLPGCRDEQGIRGFVLLDPEGEVTHIERRVSPDVPTPTGLAPFAAIDLAPVELNGKIFRLSSRLTSEYKTDRGTSSAFEGFYTACHLFSAQVTVRSGPGTLDRATPDSPRP